MLPAGTLPTLGLCPKPYTNCGCPCPSGLPKTEVVMVTGHQRSGPGEGPPVPRPLSLSQARGSFAPCSTGHQERLVPLAGNLGCPCSTAERGQRPGHHGRVSCHPALRVLGAAISVLLSGKDWVHGPHTAWPGVSAPALGSPPRPGSLSARTGAQSGSRVQPQLSRAPASGAGRDQGR